MIREPPRATLTDTRVPATALFRSPVGQNGPAGRSARRRSHERRNHRHMGQELDRTVEAVHTRENGMAAPLRRGDRAAGPVDQVNQGNPVVEGEILAESTLPALAPVAAGAAATPDGEVLATDGEIGRAHV